MNETCTLFLTRIVFAMHQRFFDSQGKAPSKMNMQAARVPSNLRSTANLTVY
jgi:hypothetical protein